MSSDEVAGFQKLRAAATKFVLEHLLALDLLAHRVFHTSANTIHALIECNFIVCELIIVIERHKVSDNVITALVCTVPIAKLAPPTRETR